MELPAGIHRCISVSRWKRIRRTFRRLRGREGLVYLAVLISFSYMVYCGVRISTLSSQLTIALDDLHEAHGIGADKDVSPTRSATAEEIQPNITAHRHSNRTEVKGNPGIIMFTRVPKCGTTMMLNLFEHIAEMNNFNVRKSQEEIESRLIWKGQQQLVDEVYNQQFPVLFQQHVRFIDFAPFKQLNPIYISIIRDPFERLLDECVEQNRTVCTVTGVYNPTIQFFCGHNVNCRISNAWSLNKAITNVIKYYSVVGVAEKSNDFLKLLELLIPNFFANAGQFYLQDIYINPQQKQQYLDRFKFTDKTINVVKQRLRMEYDFYNFVSRRFDTLYASATKA